MTITPADRGRRSRGSRRPIGPRLSSGRLLIAHDVLLCGAVTRIGVRELRQHASRYLDEVKAGATVEVTERGKLVALLVPPDPVEALRDHLVAQGRLLPATGVFRPPTQRRKAGGKRSASRHLEELRAER